GELADDEEGPAVAHHVERVGNRAILVVVLRHALDHSGSACCCEGSTCKIQASYVRLQASPTEAKGLSPHGGYGTTEMAGAGAPERGPVHGRPGHRDRERRVALDQNRPRVLPGEPPVGDQRLRPLLRRLPAPGRAGGRPARTAAALPRRSRPVHALLAAGGPGLVGGVADRGARVPGARRGGDLPGGAVDPLDDVHRGP